jgi:hypothetical protein
MHGIDLNRGWDRRADPALAPENHALETWIEAQIRAGRRPSLALELHNDGNGKLHAPRPAMMTSTDPLPQITRLEQLLRKHTWFTEGITRPTAGATTFTLGDGWLQRFEVPAAVHEFNCYWIVGLNEPASARRWEEYGAGLAKVFFEYLGGQ